jgi:hypothetical protein
MMLLMVKASGLTPLSMSVQSTGIDTGNPALARGEKAPTVVVPRPLRR